MNNVCNNIYNFVQFCTLDDMAQGTDWCPLAIFLGQLWLRLSLSSAADCSVLEGDGTCLHTHVDFVLFLKLLLVLFSLFFKEQFPFVFKHLKAFFCIHLSQYSAQPTFFILKVYSSCYRTNVFGLP